MIEAQTPIVQEEPQTSEPKVIRVSQILADLDSGMDRPAIRRKYGLTMNEIKVLFENPMLKGKRAKRGTQKVTFTLVEDITSQEEITPQEVQDNVSENANEDLFNIND
jgi:hypothetical protein